MLTKQQEEALNYFKTHAEDWRSQINGLYRDRVNTLQQRSNYVLNITKEHDGINSCLDVGCGTGELVCEIARRGIDSIGLDFAQEMIDLANKKALDENLSKAKFICCSVFDFEIQNKNYDVISANGFIEYISHQEMNTFFDIVEKILYPGGHFVFSSRNRLFNLVSMNDFTLQEIESGNLEILLKEAIRWNIAKDIKDVIGVNCSELQPPNIKHSNTGIDVSTRYQYSPLQLINLLNEKGLETMDVYPVNIHCVTPSFCKSHPEIYVPFANMMESYARGNTQLITNASTFMIHARKRRNK